MKLVVKYKVCGEVFHDLHEVREQREATPSNVAIALRYISRRMYADAKVIIFDSDMQIVFSYKNEENLDNGIMDVTRNKFFEGHLDEMKMNKGTAMRYAQEVIRDEAN